MKKTVCLLIAGILVCSMVIPAFAENKMNAQLRSDYVIEIDGEECLFTRADGSVALPILYNHTTYLPLCAIGEIMGKNANWDESAKTVIISGNRKETEKKINIVAPESKEVIVQERSDYVIKIDGNTKKFKTSFGSKMNLIVYNDSTFLSLRVIGEIMGKDIAWNDDTKTVSITSKGSSKVKTDRFETGDSLDEMVNKKENGDVDIEKAKEIALAHAELNEKQVSIEMEKEDVIDIYRVQFYLGTKKYDYEIDAVTGNVLSFDSHDVGSVGNQKTKQISIEQAKNIALSHADVKNTQATIRKAELCKNSAKVVYKVEFDTNDAEYAYTINALDGKVIFALFEKEKFESNVGQEPITMDEAKKIALDYAGVLKTNAEFNLAELYLDNYLSKYAIVFKSREEIYQFFIDAATGDILFFKKDCI